MSCDNLYTCPICKTGTIRQYNHDHHDQILEDGSFEVSVYVTCDNCGFAKTFNGRLT